MSIPEPSRDYQRTARNLPHPARRNAPACASSGCVQRVWSYDSPVADARRCTVAWDAGIADRDRLVLPGQTWSSHRKRPSCSKGGEIQERWRLCTASWLRLLEGLPAIPESKSWVKEGNALSCISCWEVDGGGRTTCSVWVTKSLVVWDVRPSLGQYCWWSYFLTGTSSWLTPCRQCFYCSWSASEMQSQATCFVRNRILQEQDVFSVLYSILLVLGLPASLPA